MKLWKMLLLSGTNDSPVTDFPYELLGIYQAVSLYLIILLDHKILLSIVKEFSNKVYVENEPHRKEKEECT